MTVYCNSGFSKDIQEKNYYVAKFLGGMIYYFQDLEFGESVKEVTHYMACGDHNYLLNIIPGISYGSRNKGIGSIFTISYDEVRLLEGKSLLEYISEELLLETSRLERVKPKKFDLSAYKQSLTEYLTQSKDLVLQGKDPSEGKVLNKFIQQVMMRKWSRL